MDSQKYLESYGWVKGEPLQKGGLRKPILVTHKFDVKGVGHQAKDTIAWWETVFDGQLRSLDVNKTGGFASDEKKKEDLEKEERKKNSPLYQMFVKGEVLRGTVDAMKDNEKTNIKRKADEIEDTESGDQLVFFFSSDEEEEDVDKTEKRKKRKLAKAAKKEKKAAKKEKKALKKEKKDKKRDKKDKKERKDKKDKNTIE